MIFIIVFDYIYYSRPDIDLNISEIELWNNFFLKIENPHICYQTLLEKLEGNRSESILKNFNIKTKDMIGEINSRQTSNTHGMLNINLKSYNNYKLIKNIPFFINHNEKKCWIKIKPIKTNF